MLAKSSISPGSSCRGRVPRLGDEAQALGRYVPLPVVEGPVATRLGGLPADEMTRRPASRRYRQLPGASDGLWPESSRVGDQRHHQLVIVSTKIATPLSLNIPNLGHKFPNMGIKGEDRESLADVLFTRGQQRVLGILFSEPNRSFPATEVITRAGVGTGAAHRELSRLVRSGLVTVTPAGRQRRYQANRESAVFPELYGLIQKTVGLAEPLRQALNPLAAEIRVAFVYGSVAKGTDTANSGIDLMIISEDLSYAQIYEALSAAEARLARTINPTILSPEEWQVSRQDDNHFIQTVVKQPRLLALGSDDGLI